MPRCGTLHGTILAEWNFSIPGMSDDSGMISETLKEDPEVEEPT